jgi:hypothetical protein
VSRLSRQCEILNISQPYTPPRPVRGLALLLYIIPEEGRKHTSKQSEGEVLYHRPVYSLVILGFWTCPSCNIPNRTWRFGNWICFPTPCTCSAESVRSNLSQWGSTSQAHSTPTPSPNFLPENRNRPGFQDLEFCRRRTKLWKPSNPNYNIPSSNPFRNNRTQQTFLTDILNHLLSIFKRVY